MDVSRKDRPSSIAARITWKNERNVHEDDLDHHNRGVDRHNRPGAQRDAGAAGGRPAHRSPAARPERHRTRVTQTIVELAPGATAPRHTHPGEEIIYVLEGVWEYTVEGKPPVSLKPGGVLFIPAGAIHSARNVGNGRAAELAAYIVEKGKPLITVVE